MEFRLIRRRWQRRVLFWSIPPVAALIWLMVWPVTSHWTSMALAWAVAVALGGIALLSAIISVVCIVISIRVWLAKGWVIAPWHFGPFGKYGETSLYDLYRQLGQRS